MTARAASPPSGRIGPLLASASWPFCCRSGRAGAGGGQPGRQQDRRDDNGVTAPERDPDLH